MSQEYNSLLNELDLVKVKLAKYLEPIIEITHDTQAAKEIQYADVLFEITDDLEFVTISLDINSYSFPASIVHSVNSDPISLAKNYMEETQKRNLEHTKHTLEENVRIATQQLKVFNETQNKEVV